MGVDLQALLRFWPTCRLLEKEQRLPQYSSDPLFASTSRSEFFDKHAPGLAVWKKKGIQWKEKGPQTHTHRHEHMFTGDHRMRQGQKPSSGAVKGVFSQEAASAFLDVGADSQVLLSILSLGVT